MSRHFISPDKKNPSALDIAEKIRQLIGGEKKGAFARRAGISPVSLSRYLAGHPPSRDALRKIARAGGVGLDYLLGFEVREPPDPYAADPPRLRRLKHQARRLLDQFLEGMSEEEFQHIKREFEGQLARRKQKRR